MFDYQGHRGCRGLMPENTIPAFLKAIDLGVTTLEMDVVITKDEKVLLSHEPFFNHEISMLKGRPILEQEEKQHNIYKMDVVTTQQYDVGMLEHKRFPQQQKIATTKPLLDSVIKAVKAYCIANQKPLPFFNIETKCLPVTDNTFHPTPATFIHLVMEVIKNNQLEQKTIIQSFDVRTLQVLHQQYPTIQTALLIEFEDKASIQEHINRLGFVPSIYSPHYALVNPTLVAACQAKNMLLIPWTVNDVATMKKLKEMGVNGLISDYPNLYKTLYYN